ncbi:hypothetical protein KOR34_11680 [Posidoniimonas corsicana]|uniref:Uncharacterized protein n=1 Tax=Posidoniimonas corsicana TaxID=1938618 RepID=A0A5C5VCD8_9BACT|nr:hypothetical protein [Posidoniimonas corsicana]TWT36264.1 hypothetical protein KOR34_11680 [Posidoniimonas corsicana]
MGEGVKKSVTLPAHVVELLQHANDLIGSEDDLATIPSDDLIQTEAGYGGLDRGGGNQYSFVLFPEQGTKPRWEVTLLADEIDEIASGFRDSIVVREFS